MGLYREKIDVIIVPAAGPMRLGPMFGTSFNGSLERAAGGNQGDARMGVEEACPGLNAPARR